jgi:hypothetical protein
MLAAVAAAALQLAPAAADDSRRALAIEAATLRLSRGSDQESGIGKLVFRGALRLKSDDTDFGGLSGLVVSRDRRRFLAVTDASHWVTGTLDYRDGKLTDVRGGEIAPLRDIDGQPLEGKEGDAESLTQSADGVAYVGFERDHRIWRYDVRTHGLDAKAEAIGVPAELAGAPENSGLEGITLLKDGRLLALTEGFKDGQGNLRGWIIGADGPARFDPLTLKARAPFALTDVRQLGNGDILTLERRFSRVGGVGFQMRRVPGATLGPGAVLDGTVVAEAGMAYVIDNMEGLSVNTGENGETLVYIVSDDNFNAPLQQTLLMMFELRD